MLMNRDILYAPDFVINGAGLINVYQEFFPPYNREETLRKVEKIYDRLLKIFAYAKKHKINNQVAANKFAEERIKLLKDIHANYIPGAKTLKKKCFRKTCKIIAHFIYLVYNFN